MKQVMEIFFAVLTHGLIICGLLLQLYFMIQMVLIARVHIERILRASAFGTGLLILFGAKSLGLSISELTMSGAALSHPITFGIFGVITPSAIGVMLAWYFVNSIKKSSNIAIRVMILVGTFSLMIFADAYLGAVSTSGDFKPDKSLAPNLAFIISVMLYTILRYDPDDTAAPIRIRDLFRRFKRPVGASYYYHTEKGTEAGPFSFADIKKCQQKGEINGDTYVFKEGERDWRKASEFAELSS